MTHPKALRWWLEEWKPKHRGDCDCNGCSRPLMSCLKSQLDWQDNPENKYRKDGITVEWLDGLASRTHAHRTIKLLERHGLIHGCYAIGRHRQTVYKLGGANDCPSPEHHGDDFTVDQDQWVM